MYEGIDDEKGTTEKVGDLGGALGAQMQTLEDGYAYRVDYSYLPVCIRRVFYSKLQLSEYYTLTTSTTSPQTLLISSVLSAATSSQRDSR